MDDHPIDDFFDDEKLQAAMQKGKKKSTLKIILISVLIALLVFAILLVGNAALMIKKSNEMNSYLEYDVQFTVPNGYISESSDTMGFLGGISNYTISRLVGDKPVILEDRVQPFGYVPQLILNRGRGGGGQIAGEWPTNYWEEGYRKMIFFHPEITYKEYKNDLELLDQISADKLIEVGISFDKPYEISEISTILPNVKTSWYWINAFRKSDLVQYQKEAREYDAKATFIYEFQVLGVSVSPFNRESDFAGRYSALLDGLKNSKDPRYNEVYDELITQNYTNYANVPILGVIVYGTKDELKSLLGNPHIKAATFGVIVDKY
ncbi:anti-sigma factor [Desulfitobacterium metallireducens]|uniref:Sigma factor regulator C-terminal domain-containing protein n=1 Tax=Desulfitobacterium metallireducens DSM 15288 TaxID=871968 RepID=W0EBX0_9FIRM|nr:anti-sigma factor [Desulfitobacterium metallireducens]AHF08252.1 hypothetical protein DESME_15365 [Desulfitobacterium metallireducens DSM 15288]